MKKIIIECGNETIEWDDASMTSGVQTFTKTSHEIEVPDDFDPLAFFEEQTILFDGSKELLANSADTGATSLPE